MSFLTRISRKNILRNCKTPWIFKGFYVLNYSRWEIVVKLQLFVDLGINTGDYSRWEIVVKLQHVKAMREVLKHYSRWEIVVKLQRISSC